MKQAIYLPVLLASLIVAACGGGSGGDSGSGSSSANVGSGNGVASAQGSPAQPDAVAPISEASNLYVATNGSDSNNGTQASPFKTIAKAASVAQPGTTVHVAAGTYPGSFLTSASGTSSAHIRYVSDVQWAAKIVPPSYSNSIIAWTQRGDYVDIVGFEIDGTNTQGGTKWRDGIVSYASYGFIAQNKVHNIANSPSDCVSEGGSGLNATALNNGYHVTMDSNTVYNIGVADCQFIHGIYMSTSGTVSNNLVYQIGYGGIHLYHDASNINIVNNTVFATKMALIVATGGAYHMSGPTDYINVTNNIFYDNMYGAIEMGLAGPHNYYSNNLTFKNTYNFALDSNHYNDIVAEPQFISYIRTGGGDYRLSSSSPAYNTGLSTNAPSHDHDGVVRPAHGQVDVGAFEIP